MSVDASYLPHDDALTVAEVSDLLRVSSGTVYGLRKSGLLRAYQVGRKLRFTRADVDAYIAAAHDPVSCAVPELLPMPLLGSDSTGLGSGSGTGTSTGSGNGSGNGTGAPAPSFIIAGQDVVLDILGNYLHQMGIEAGRVHLTSYDSLVALYRGQVQVAAINLWSGDTDEYSVPYVKRFLPGIKTAIIRLVGRTQGFYVSEGNPKHLRSWEDLRQPALQIINREKGSGSRILLDEQLKLLGVEPQNIAGYRHEVPSPMAIASMIAQAKADVALGDERTARRTPGVDFVPLKKERYDLVVKQEEMDTLPMQALLRYLESGVLRDELNGLGGYDTAHLGRILWMGERKDPHSNR